MRRETTLVSSAVAALGRDGAERVYDEHLVRRALQIETGFRRSLMTHGHR
nr:hypothetical protein [Streptomyces sp. SAT1]